jgi:hypothetical protein
MEKFPFPFVFVLLLALAPAALADAPRTAAVFLPARATALERALAHGAIAALGLRGSATGDAASSEELLLQGTATSPVLHAVVVESVCARAPARGGVLGETEGFGEAGVYLFCVCVCVCVWRWHGSGLLFVGLQFFEEN